MTTFAEALLRIPSNFYLSCQVEQDDEEENERYLAAVLMEVPPEGGWTIPTYFNEPPGVKRAHTEEWLEPHRHKDVPRVGVTGLLDDPANFERMVIDMIVRRWPEPTDIARDPESELKAALERRLDSCFCDDVGQWPECKRCLAIRELIRILEERPAPPVPMLLWCPKCHVQHVDRGEWATPAKAHRRHLCEKCGENWRPAAVATVGVEKLPED